MGSESNGGQQHVQPSPTPVTTNLRRVRSDDGKSEAVILTIYSPTGVHVSFWTPEAIAGFGRSCIAAGSGLHLAGPDDMP